MAGSKICRQASPTNGRLRRLPLKHRTAFRLTAIIPFISHPIARPYRHPSSPSSHLLTPHDCPPSLPVVPASGRPHEQLKHTTHTHTHKLQGCAKRVSVSPSSRKPRIFSARLRDRRAVATARRHTGGPFHPTTAPAAAVAAAAAAAATRTHTHTTGTTCMTVLVVNVRGQAALWAAAVVVVVGLSTERLQLLERGRGVKRAQGWRCPGLWACCRGRRLPAGWPRGRVSCAEDGWPSRRKH